MRAVFADTFYWVATVLPDDPWFPVVADVSAKLNDAHFVTTDEVLTEFLAHLSSWGPHYRRAAVELVRTVLEDEDVTVIPQSRESFLGGLDLFLTALPSLVFQQDSQVEEKGSAPVLEERCDALSFTIHFFLISGSPSSATQGRGVGAGRRGRRPQRDSSCADKIINLISPVKPSFLLLIYCFFL